MARGQLSGGAWGALVLLGLMLPVAPAGAWYKHVASPRYHTVGRASGLLMGVRRSPYLWRRELPAELPRRPPGSAAAPQLPPGRPDGETPPPAPPPPGPGRLLERLLRRGWGWGGPRPAPARAPPGSGNPGPDGQAGGGGDGAPRVAFEGCHCPACGDRVAVWLRHPGVLPEVHQLLPLEDMALIR